MRDRLRYALLIASALSGVAIFTAFTFYEKPGLGLGHFFYVSIILAALVTGPAIGAAAAVIATAMFATGVIINPQIPPSEVLTTSTGIRFVTFVTVGIVTGYFAKRNRTLLAELRLLADRDALTGLPNTRVFHRPQQHGVGLATGVERRRRQVVPRLLVADRAAVEGAQGKLERAGGPFRGAQYLDRLGRDLGADAVSTDDCDSMRHRRSIVTRWSCRPTGIACCGWQSTSSPPLRISACRPSTTI